jgi:MFS family permease
MKKHQLPYPLHLIILVSAVYVSGAAQGLLLPLLSILLEDDGTSSALNGINATGLYIGVLLASPFIERPMQKYGYRPILLFGLAIVGVTLFLFPLYHNFFYWFILRIIVGVGDNMLNFSAQVWITVKSPPEKKGRNIAIYGLAFGLGFSTGPLLARLLFLGEAWPFIVAGLGCMLITLLCLYLKNDHPEGHEEIAERFQALSRYKKVWLLGWSGLMITFAYGFLEASLHGNFPVFALRSGYSVDSISVLLPIFVIGSIITQIPMGTLGDRFGRRHILIFSCILGIFGFSFDFLVANHFWPLAFGLLFTGMSVGSLFSFGMAYLSDLLPNGLIPVGNIMAGATFSFGSMIGPFFGGVLIQWVPSAFFLLIGLAIASALFSTFFHNKAIWVQDSERKVV